MTTKIAVPQLRLRYSGLFDFVALYVAIKEWCEDHQYEWHEQTTKHKVPSPKGAKQEFTWLANREVTDYIGYYIKIGIISWETTEIQVQQKGKKKKLTNARIEFVLNGTVKYDWQNIWVKNKFSKWLGGLYDKYVMRRDLEGIYFDGLVYSMYDLHALMKKFFDSQTKAHVYSGVLR